MTILPLLIYPDPLESSLTYLRARLPARSETVAQGVTIGSYLPRTKVPPFVLVRRVGGFLSGSGVDKARLDFHVYHRSEHDAQYLTQLVRGLILQMPSSQTVPVFGAREFTGPGPAVDPDWPEAVRYYFTVELTLRGVAV